MTGPALTHAAQHIDPHRPVGAVRWDGMWVGSTQHLTNFALRYIHWRVAGSAERTMEAKHPHSPPIPLTTCLLPSQYDNNQVFHPPREVIRAIRVLGLTGPMSAAPMQHRPAVPSPR